MGDVHRYIVTVRALRSARYSTAMEDVYEREISGTAIYPKDVVAQAFKRIEAECEVNFYLYDEVVVSMRMVR